MPGIKIRLAKWKANILSPVLSLHPSYYFTFCGSFVISFSTTMCFQIKGVLWMNKWKIEIFVFSRSYENLVIFKISTVKDKFLFSYILPGNLKMCVPIALLEFEYKVPNITENKWTVEKALYLGIKLSSYTYCIKWALEKEQNIFIQPLINSSIYSSVQG